MKRTVAVALALALLGCTAGEEAAPVSPARKAESQWKLGQPREVAIPAGAGASIPSIAAHNDAVVLGWMERTAEKGHLRFRLSTRRQGTWSEPSDVRAANDFFANWADTPNVAMTADGTLFAQWLQKSGGETYDYAINIARSTDGGKNWLKPVVPHTTAVASEFGFVSMRPDPAAPDGVALSWLDGRDMKEEGVGQMALRFARMNARGALRDEAILDQRVCECCQTGMAVSGSTAAIVYRDRDEQEVRDTGFVRVDGASVTAPAVVHRDGWKIDGCPVNGPQIDAHGDALAVAWFTGAETNSGVFAAFSSDGGKTFSTPQRVSSSEALGRVGIEMIDEDTAAVSWMEKRGAAATVQLRLVRASGVEPPVTVGTTTSSRASGFPRLARSGDNLLVVWTIPGEPSRIALREIPLEKGL